MNTTQCPWLGLEPGPLDLESSALTMRPLRMGRRENWEKKRDWKRKKEKRGDPLSLYPPWPLQSQLVLSPPFQEWLDPFWLFLSTRACSEAEYFD